MRGFCFMLYAYERRFVYEGTGKEVRLPGVRL